MQSLEVMRNVRERLEVVMNSEDENASVYDEVSTIIAEYKTVEKICENLPEYEQSDVIEAFFGGKEGENEP